MHVTFIVHESRVDEFVLALDGECCVHVDEVDVVERTSPDTRRLRERLADLMGEVRMRGLEESGAAFAVGPRGGAPEELGDGELMREVASVKGRIEVWEATRRFGRVGSVYVAEGWVPRDRVGELSAVEEAVDGLCDWFLENPRLEGVPPTRLENPGVAKVPELLVRTYGLPSYFEVDPSIIVAVTFPLIFGLMYGDLGHALFLLVLAWGVGRVEMAPEGSRPLLLSLAGTSAVFGALYGEVFGLHVFEAVWFARIDNVILLTQVSLVVGVLHMVLGLGLQGVNSYLNRRVHRVMTVLPWVAFYLLLVPVVLGDFSWLRYAGSAAVLVAAGAVGASVLEGEGVGPGLLETLRRLFESTLHVSSYIRIAAVSLTHVVFSDLLLDVLGPSPARFAAWFLLTLLLIVGVETFFASLQTVRLHWTEWFFNFYEGEGRPFEPFSLER